jgi:predicted DsbA family dithiol-disulfide isomerase
LEPLRVDVWSDLVCPWCYTGLHRLRRVAAAAKVPIDVVHHAYQLDPTRKASAPTKEALARRYGGDIDAMLANAERAGATEGLAMRLAQSISCNTFDGHRVVAFARTQGLQDAVVRHLMQAHFELGADLGDHATLVRLAAEAGLLATDVEDVLSSARFGDEVEGDVDQARQMGVRGVPFFVFGGRFAFSGAQPDEAFREALRLASVPSDLPPAS